MHWPYLPSESASNGTTVNVFDTLGELPPYSETLEADRTPDSVVALRAAATEADAALVVTNYHGRVPTMVHNAIDWLTLRWNQSALHDKPLAVIGRADGYFFFFFFFKKKKKKKSFYASR